MTRVWKCNQFQYLELPKKERLAHYLNSVCQPLKLDSCIRGVTLEPCKSFVTILTALFRGKPCNGETHQHRCSGKESGDNADLARGFSGGA